MNAGATAANVLWLAGSVRASRRLTRALAAPADAQRAWLLNRLACDATSAFGRAHDFAAIASHADFARRVPITDYAGVDPWIQRIRGGEQNVLGCGRVTHLAPTSGSTGGRKLIPFTAALQAGFSQAVGAWLVDLARLRPALIGGPAYWSVSPLADDGPSEDAGSAVPIGFADDADYLGGATAWLVRRALAVPSSVRHVHDDAAFWRLTLLALLRQRDLRFISVWHPSFLDLIVSTAEPCWRELLDAIASGECPWLDALPQSARAEWRAAPDPRRATELRGLGSHDWPRWWPRLQVVSCWGEQAAAAGWMRLRDRLPDVLVQAKGLLATEAVVTVPIAGQLPLAITSHYFEFLDETGGARLAHELVRGERYEVVVTNGGGLWRYRLGDVVECTGHLRATPSLRFLGRAGNVSDLRGEKLSEPFVAEALRALWKDEAPPLYAVLRAWERAGLAGYELLVSADALATPAAELAARLEAALRANPHYALARRLGQLEPLRAIAVAPDFARDELRTRRERSGDAKPQTLVGANDGPRS